MSQPVYGQPYQGQQYPQEQRNPPQQQQQGGGYYQQESQPQPQPQGQYYAQPPYGGQPGVYPAPGDGAPQPYAQPYPAGGGYGYAPPAAAAVIMTSPDNHWSSGLCSCFDDVSTCLYGCICSPFLTVENKARIEGRSAEAGDYCFGCLLCLCTYGIGLWCIQSLVEFQDREDLGTKMGFLSAGGDNFFIALCCFPCSSCQVAREVEHRERLGQLIRYGNEVFVGQPPM